MAPPTSSPPSSTANAAGQRAVLRTVRLRMPPNTRTPSALPCHNYYDVFPDEIGPFGNIVVTCAAELQKWLLVARPVTREQAEKDGGCITYTPATTQHEASASQGAAEPQYYCITDSDDVVYGRAAYLPHPPRRFSVKQCSSVDATSSAGSCGCSDIGSTVEEVEPIDSPAHDDVDHCHL